MHTMLGLCTTVNVEIFAGLNVHGFQAYCEGFSMSA